MIDYLDFEKKVRAAEPEFVKKLQKKYIKYFKNCKNVLDIACGRGEFLELLNEKEIKALGVDNDKSIVKHVKKKGLNIVQSDALDFLKKNEKKFDGIFCSHLVEHMHPKQLLRFLTLCYKTLRKNGVVVIITPNVTSILTHIDTFYKDHTHIRFYHPDLLNFFLEETGFKILELGEDESYKIPFIEEKKIELGRLPQTFGKPNSLFGYPKYLLRKFRFEQQKNIIQNLNKTIAEIETLLNKNVEKTNFILFKLFRSYDIFVVAKKI
jgi:SAM-dependent methyltransferase